MYLPKNDMLYTPTIYDCMLKCHFIKNISNEVMKKLNTYDKCMKNNQNDVDKCIIERKKLLYYLSIPA